MPGEFTSLSVRACLLAAGSIDLAPLRPLSPPPTPGPQLAAQQERRNALRSLPAARDKTRGVTLAYRASSPLDQAEPELAAPLATEPFLLACRLGAPRCIKLVNNLLPRFQPHQQAQGVTELLQLAAA